MPGKSRASAFAVTVAMQEVKKHWGYPMSCHFLRQTTRRQACGSSTPCTKVTALLLKQDPAARLYVAGRLGTGSLITATQQRVN